MGRQRVLFFDAKPYDERFFNEANSQYGLEIKYFSGHLNADTVGFTKGYDAICAFVNDSINKPVLEELKKNGVGLIALRCAGYNNVDIKTAQALDLRVARVPGYSPHAVAEHAVALMLTLNRKTHKAYYRTRDTNFSINGLLGFDMCGKTAGIIGTGKIGRCVIGILKGFGMHLLAYDAFPNKTYAKKMEVEYVSLEKLYSESDIISLHCPLIPETEHLICEQSISQMKKGVMLINTGRGSLVHTQSLINALKNGQVGAAGLDVYEEESDYFFEDFSASGISDDVLARLLTFPNVLVTSHQAFFTKEALTNIAETTLENIHAFFEREDLANAIKI